MISDLSVSMSGIQLIALLYRILPHSCQTIGIGGGNWSFYAKLFTSGHWQPSHKHRAEFEIGQCRLRLGVIDVVKCSEA